MRLAQRCALFSYRVVSLPCIPAPSYLLNPSCDQVFRLASVALPLAAKLKAHSSSTDIASIDIAWESLAEKTMRPQPNALRFLHVSSLRRRDQQQKEVALAGALARFLGVTLQVQPSIAAMLKSLGEGLLGGLLAEVGAASDEQLATELAVLLSNEESTPQARRALTAPPIFSCRRMTSEASATTGRFSASVSFSASINGSRRIIATTGEGTDSGWMPSARRYDKSHANAFSTVEAGKAAAANPALNTASALQDSMLHSLDARSRDMAMEVVSPCSEPPQHPALQIPFADFKQLLDEAAGSIEQTRIYGTELVVLNARSAPEVSSDILAMCRGLVISESAVVAAPFCKFGRADGSIDRCQLVEATEKIDGSHIIAFFHEGEIITCTKRRADSEQALWSKAYLQGRDVALKPGFTYMFEAVYRDNAVVVKYQQDECILIAARDESGVELNRVALLAEGRRMELHVVVMMKGRCAEFVRDAEDASNLTSEGWVLKSCGDGVNLRGKVVRKAWSSASRASVDNVSPLAAAHAFGINIPDSRRREPLLATHHTLELEMMREALLCYWLRLRRRLGGLLDVRAEEDLDSQWVESVLSRMAAALRRVPEWREIVQEGVALVQWRSLIERVKPLLDSRFYDGYGRNSASVDCIAGQLLCLLVRARCIEGTIPGYRASICAKGTLAKGWARRVLIEPSSLDASTPSLASLPLELLEPVLAHLDRCKNVSLVCHGLYQAVHSSAEVAQHAVEQATCHLEQTADRLFGERSSPSGGGSNDGYGSNGSSGYDSGGLAPFNSYGSFNSFHQHDGYGSN